MHLWVQLKLPFMLHLTGYILLNFVKFCLTAYRGDDAVDGSFRSTTNKGIEYGIDDAVRRLHSMIYFGVHVMVHYLMPLLVQFKGYKKVNPRVYFSTLKSVDGIGLDYNPLLWYTYRFR